MTSGRSKKDSKKGDCVTHESVDTPNAYSALKYEHMEFEYSSVYIHILLYDSDNIKNVIKIINKQLLYCFNIIYGNVTKDI